VLRKSTVRNKVRIIGTSGCHTSYRDPLIPSGGKNVRILSRYLLKLSSELRQTLGGVSSLGQLNISYA
jgi:hypothetical protein